MSRMGFVLLVAAALLAQTISPSVSGQNPALALDLTEVHYERIRRALTSSGDESGWRKIPWRPNLGEAVVEARKKKKPILLWMMNGHPCGMT